MIQTLITLASNIAGAIKEAFSFQSKKLDLKNTDKMEAAQEAVNEVKVVDAEQKAVAGKSLEELRKDLAE